MKKVFSLLVISLSTLTIHAGIWDGIKHGVEEDAWCVEHALKCEGCKEADDHTSPFCKECWEKCDRGDD